MDYAKHFDAIVKQQLERLEIMKSSPEFTDYSALDKIVIGVIPGDGIGKIITPEALRVLENLLAKEIADGKIEIRMIEGLTIENRVEKLAAIPEDVLEEIKKCNVLLKGPTMTPGKGDNLPNIESANVAMRKALDLFANVRPVSIPEKNINWIFYRENTEGEYALGSSGVEINEEMAIDFKVTTDHATRRLARVAFEYAKANGNLNVSIITKANIMKKTDGKFLSICYEVAKDYPEINVDDWYVDIASANLLNEKRRTAFNVFILPNLYGDIITDEAAQLQGGVGTAGSANIGGSYAMFEAIHGSAPRMVENGYAPHANPASIIKASEMLLRHIGFIEKANALSEAVEYASKNTKMTGRPGGNTAKDFADCVINKMKEG